MGERINKKTTANFGKTTSKKLRHDESHTIQTIWFLLVALGAAFALLSQLNAAPGSFDRVVDSDRPLASLYLNHNDEAVSNAPTLGLQLQKRKSPLPSSRLLPRGKSWSLEK